MNIIKVKNIAELRTRKGTLESVVEVLGYYTEGDGGGNQFYWNPTSTSSDNGGTIIQVTGNSSGRWLSLQSDKINLQQFGAIGDGVTNDYLAIVAFFKWGNTSANYLRFGKEKTYLFNPPSTDIASTSIYKLVVNDGTHLDMNGSTLVHGTTDTDNTLIWINGSNIVIENGSFIGNNTTSNTEFNMGVRIEPIVKCENIILKNLNFSNFRGDAILIGQGLDGGFLAKNVVIENITCTNIYRNGISIIQGEDILINNFRDSGTGFLSIDLEPDANYEKIKNVEITNSRFGAFSIGSVVTRTDLFENISIHNCDINTNRLTAGYYQAIVNRPINIVSTKNMSISNTTITSNTPNGVCVVFDYSGLPSIINFTDVIIENLNNSAIDIFANGNSDITTEWNFKNIKITNSQPLVERIWSYSNVKAENVLLIGTIKKVASNGYYHLTNVNATVTEFGFDSVRNSYLYNCKITAPTMWRQTGGTAPEDLFFYDCDLTTTTSLATISNSNRKNYRTVNTKYNGSYVTILNNSNSGIFNTNPIIISGQTTAFNATIDNQVGISANAGLSIPIYDLSGNVSTNYVGFYDGFTGNFLGNFRQNNGRAFLKFDGSNWSLVYEMSLSSTVIEGSYTAESNSTTTTNYTITVSPIIPAGVDVSRYELYKNGVRLKRTVRWNYISNAGTSATIEVLATPSFSIAIGDIFDIVIK